MPGKQVTRSRWPRKRRRAREGAAFTLVLVALGCGQVEETLYSFSASVPTRLELPICDAETENEVFFVEEEEEYFRCQNGAYTTVRLVDQDDSPPLPDGSAGSSFPGSTGGALGIGGRFSSGGSSGEDAGGASDGGAPSRGSGGSTRGGGSGGTSEGGSSGGSASGGQAGGGSPPDKPFDPYEEGWIRWLGVLEGRPSNPEIGDALYWESEDSICVWDGMSWVLLYSALETADCKAWEESETFPIPEETRDVLWLSTAMDDAGNAFVTWTGQASDHLSFGDYTYAQRYAAGQGWDPSIQLGESQSIWPDVAATGNGKAIVLWLDERAYPQPRTETRFERTTWQPSLSVDELDSLYGVLEVQFDSSDNAVATWTADQDAVVSTRPWLGSWSKPVVVGRGLGEALAFQPRLAVGPAGTLCAYWVNADLDTKAWDVYVSLYTPNKGWSAQLRIYEAEGIVRYPSATFDQEGNMILAFTDEVDAAQPVFAVTYDGSTFSKAQRLSAPTESAVDVRTTYTRAGEAIVIWDGQGGISAVSKTVDGTFSAPSSWSGSAEDPLLVPLGDADALVTWVQGHQVFARRYAPSVGWMATENLGKTAIFEVHALASDSKGNAIATWAREEAFVTKFYH